MPTVVHLVQDVDLAVDLVHQAILSTYHQNSQPRWPNSTCGRNTENVCDRSHVIGITASKSVNRVDSTNYLMISTHKQE